MTVLYAIAGLSILPLILWGVWAQIHVRRVFHQYARERIKKGVTGCALAQRMLKKHGVKELRIVAINHDLHDHYDPRTRVIRLSKTVSEGSSISAIGIAAHEAAHAIQDHENDFFVKARNSMAPVIEKSAYWLLPLLFIGFVFGGVTASPFFLDLAVIIYFAIVVFYLVTLPTELDASGRALRFIQAERIATPHELEGIKKVLKAAALTYVIAAALAIVQFLRLLGVSTLRRR